MRLKMVTENEFVHANLNSAFKRFIATLIDWTLNETVFCWLLLACCVTCRYVVASVNDKF